MAKFMAIFNADVTAQQQMAASTPEQMQASMAEWQVWFDNANKTIKVDWGMPLQAITRIKADGSQTASDTEASGYMMLEGGKDQVVELLKTHPHLKRPNATMDVMELLSMPGMDA